MKFHRNRGRRFSKELLTEFIGILSTSTLFPSLSLLIKIYDPTYHVLTIFASEIEDRLRKRWNLILFLGAWLASILTEKNKMDGVIGMVYLAIVWQRSGEAPGGLSEREASLMIAH
ncbi:hypothetical protein VNO77_32812 [Canavalia gladiata]|uniref:Uncharacterized protein n=1 Tax=Canavalia gladiata TaxID=3824 RepID=A0AAN9Q2D7_CANGL